MSRSSTRRPPCRLTGVEIARCRTSRTTGPPRSAAATQLAQRTAGRLRYASPISKPGTRMNSTSGMPASYQRKSTGRGDHYNYTETPQRELTPATQAGAAPELVREPPSPDSASSFAGSPLCRVSRDNYIRRTSLHATKISRVSNTAMFATSDGSESITRHNATWIVSERHLYFTRTGGTGA
jgi:hypothetical protein